MNGSVARYLYMAALAFAGFMVYRTYQWHRDAQKSVGERTWSDAFSQALSAFPSGPPDFSSVKVTPGKVTIVSNTGSAMGV